MAGIIGTGNTVKLFGAAYTAQGKSKDANLELAKEIVAVRGADPKAQASKDKVAEVWTAILDGNTYDPDRVKSLKNAINYIVRDLDCQARGTTLAEALKSKREEKKTAKLAADKLAAELKGEGENGDGEQGQGDGKVFDPIAYGRSHPVEAAAMVTTLLAGIEGAVTSPHELDAAMLRNALKAARDGLAEVAKCLAERTDGAGAGTGASARNAA